MDTGLLKETTATGVVLLLKSNALVKDYRSVFQVI